jgi:hypothetical protein
MNYEMMQALVEAVTRLGEHLEVISKKLEALEKIDNRLKSIDRKTEDSTRVGSSRAWGD